MASDATRNGPHPGGTADAAAQPAQGQQLIVNAQYIKDLSFENPRAPNSLRPQTMQPQVEINVDVRAENLAPDAFEVVLTIKSSAKIQEEARFIVELAYAGVITVRNVPQEFLSTVVLVETPRLLFPFARNIIADTTRDGGFPPLMINPIDFAELLRRNAAPQTEAQPGGIATV
jgi:preprotein translocase subunit SecB